MAWRACAAAAGALVAAAGLAGLDEVAELDGDATAAAVAEEAADAVLAGRTRVMAGNTSSTSSSLVGASGVAACALTQSMASASNVHDRALKLQGYRRMAMTFGNQIQAETLAGFCITQTSPKEKPGSPTQTWDPGHAQRGPFRPCRYSAVGSAVSSVASVTALMSTGSLLSLVPARRLLR